MDVLIAHSGEASRRSLAKVLLPLGLHLTEATDGAEALDILLAEEAPSIALIDWDVPRIEGPELCRLVRDFHIQHPPYVILLAGSAQANEVPVGLTRRRPRLRAHADRGRRAAGAGGDGAPLHGAPVGADGVRVRRRAHRGAVPQGRRAAAGRRAGARAGANGRS